MIDGVIYRADFIAHPDDLFRKLMQEVLWDDRMKSRKTASFGRAYNYGQMTYPVMKMLPALDSICQRIYALLGFAPNNCLLNLYENGRSKMGFHSDQIDILQDGTGVVIISLGAVRNLRFRQIADKTIQMDYPLAHGSLLYMNQASQASWQHAIPKDDTTTPRMSLTFRNIVSG